jgi:hypothetical protein
VDDVQGASRLLVGHLGRERTKLLIEELRILVAPDADDVRK